MIVFLNGASSSGKTALARARDGYDLVLDQVVFETADLKPYVSAHPDPRSFLLLDSELNGD